MRPSRSAPLKTLLGGLAMSAATAISAEPVTISVQQETAFGQSVFVSADHPLLGARQIRRAVKLSPHAYPIWQATVDLPPGLTLPLTFHLRTDSPGQLANGNNGTVASTGSITTPAGSVRAQRLTVHAAAGATVRAVVTASAPGFTPLSIPLIGANGVYTGEVPGEQVAMGRLLQIEVNGTGQWAAPRRLHGAPTVLHHGQTFLGEAPTTAPTAPRVETFSFTPAGFASRTIRIQLPRGYTESTSRSYPVIIAQDGQNVFSPGGAFGSWDLDLTITRLVRDGEIPEVILVGVDNSSARLQEYMPEWVTYQGNPGRGGAFLTALRDGLLPELANRYRVSEEAADRVHVGSSLGGILGWEAAQTFQATFGTVAVMSPSFWLNRDRVLADATKGPDGFARMWLDSGIAGTSNDGYADTIATRDRLLQSGHVLGPDFQHVFGYYETGQSTEPGHEHNEAAWRNRAPEVLRWALIPQLNAIGTPAPGQSTAWLMADQKP